MNAQEKKNTPQKISVEMWEDGQWMASSTEWKLKIFHVIKSLQMAASSSFYFFFVPFDPISISFSFAKCARISDEMDVVRAAAKRNVSLAQ